MYPSRESRIQALGETFGYNKFVRDLLKLEVRLEGLHQAINYIKVYYPPAYAP